MATRYLHTTVDEITDLFETRTMARRLIPHLAWRHHGIGVLQAYIAEGTENEIRLHIWHPDLLRDGVKDSGQIHDHRFRLRSAVLHGSIRHDEYNLTAATDGPWQRFTVVNARKGDHSDPIPVDGFFDADIVAGIVGEGRVYEFEAGCFHRSMVSQLTVTLVTKLQQQDRKAMLLAPRGAAPTHGFKDNTPVSIEKYLQLAIDALGESR